MRWRDSTIPAGGVTKSASWILSTRMMPPIVTIIPLYLAFNYLNMLNTKPGSGDRLHRLQPAIRHLDDEKLFPGSAGRA
jgi:hypothetical protein